jgi:hypothetical protein
MSDLFDWEIDPSDGERESPDYVIWREHNSVAVASWTDPCERFHLSTPQEIDELIDRLRGARAWLVDQARP